jgi:uridine kinase
LLKLGKKSAVIARAYSTGECMTREEMLTVLVTEIIRRKKPHMPFKIGIDGRGASGKSSLANSLASPLRASSFQVLQYSIDDFHYPRERRYRQGEYSPAGYYRDAFNHQAAVDSLLRPLSGNVFPVVCRPLKFNLQTNTPDIAATPVMVEANSVLIFDGLFLFRRELNAYWDLRILLDVDLETSLLRAVERDTSVLGPPDLVRRKYELRYEPAWQIYLNEVKPEAEADIIIENSDISNPRIGQQNS